MVEIPDTEKLCRDLWRYTAILSRTNDARAIEVLREIITETEERLFAIEEAAERSAE